MPTSSSAAPRRPRRRGGIDEAAALYGRCLAIDPGDAVAAFNRANCLRAAGREAEAEAELARALKLDPGFVEAWFNLAGAGARHAGARRRRARHLQPAIALDPDYADAVFNLATLEFDAGDLAGGAALVGALPRARRGLGLGAEGGARASRFVDLQLARDAAG